MAREPDVALFKAASGSLACGQILADFLQSTAKQRIPPERPFKVATAVVFCCHIARLDKFVWDWKIDTIAHLHGSHGNQLNMRLSWLF